MATATPMQRAPLPAPAGVAAPRPLPPASPPPLLFFPAPAHARPAPVPAPAAAIPVAVGTTPPGDADAPGRGDGLIPAPPASAVPIGPLKLHAYGAAIALGVGAGGAAATAMLRASGAPTAGLGKVVGPALVAGLVGARAYHVATDWEKYRDNPVDALKVWNGGLGIYGGLAAGLAVGAVLAHRAKLPIAPILDAAAIGMPIAQAFGRLGNYANQELYGAPTDAPWGLQVDPEHRPEGLKDRNSFHPTFAYEAAGNVALAGGLFALAKAWKGRPPGIMLPLYAIGYGAIRLGVEELRIDESKSAGGLRTNQWTSLAVMGAGAIGAAALLLRR